MKLNMQLFHRQRHLTVSLAFLAILLLLAIPAFPMLSNSTSAAPAAYQSGYCRPGYVPEQFIGGESQVTPGLPNRIRTTPSIDDRIGVVIGEVPGGGVVTVIDGPVCADGYGWWKINYEGNVGWTADGDGNYRWLERLPGTFGSYEGAGCPANLPTRLVTGQPARVTPGLPNALRDKPGKNNATSTVIST
ncbi:MAG TPA: SH3 domain-containing protein, partial [Phototrophicaceae bacterium]|nr:SH3 domain-containing protein [Phototrophicaceae bacterium]